MRRSNKANNPYVSCYDDQRRKNAPVQLCFVCGETGGRDSMHRHHPAGRDEKNVLFYIYAHDKCHHKIHDNPKWAEERGFLIPGRHRKILEQHEIEGLKIKMRANVPQIDPSTLEQLKGRKKPQPNTGLATHQPCIITEDETKA